MCQIYRPNTGLQVRHESLAELEKKYRKVASEEAEPHWTEQYDASVNTCSHAYWNGNCRNVSLGNDCEVGGITASLHLCNFSLLISFRFAGWSAPAFVSCARRFSTFGVGTCGAYTEYTIQQQDASDTHEDNGGRENRWHHDTKVML